MNDSLGVDHRRKALSTSRRSFAALEKAARSDLDALGRAVIGGCGAPTDDERDHRAGSRGDNFHQRNMCTHPDARAVEIPDVSGTLVRRHPIRVDDVLHVTEPAVGTNDCNSS